MEETLLNTIMEALGGGGLGPIIALIAYHYFYSKKEREKNAEEVIKMDGRVKHLEAVINDMKTDTTKTCSHHMQLVNSLVTEKVFNEAITAIKEGIQEIRNNMIELNRRVDAIHE